ncbi:hypothetical protein FB107DRAFT_275341 [Schizophyllum commune]
MASGTGVGDVAPDVASELASGVDELASDVDELASDVDELAPEVDELASDVASELASDVDELAPDVNELASEADVPSGEGSRPTLGTTPTLGNLTGSPSNSAHPPLNPISTTRSRMRVSSSFLGG